MKVRIHTGGNRRLAEISTEKLVQRRPGPAKGHQQRWGILRKLAHELGHRNNR